MQANKMRKYFDSSIKVEAEMSDYGMAESNKSLTSKSFIEDLAKQTKNYDRVSQTYAKHSNEHNKDSGIDSHKDGFFDDRLYRIYLSSNDDTDDLSTINFKNNRKLLKRLNNCKKIKKESNESSSMNTSIDTIILKQELKKSKDLDIKIRKAIIDLFALDKLEKQKKLDILRKQRIIQLQRIKLNDLKFLKKNFIELNNSEISKQEDDDGISLSEAVKFPSIVRKYNPYNMSKDDIPASRVTDGNILLDDYDQFYLQNKSLANYKNNVSFDEIMKIINEVETREKLSGHFTDSNYYFNGHLIKPSSKFNLNNNKRCNLNNNFCFFLFEIIVI